MIFSCIIGTYNPRIEWLTRAIDSAVGLFDELILVDDGSFPPISKELTAKYDIKHIRHPGNLGFYEAKNSAISAATGDIIATLDDDDFFDSEAVNELKTIVEKSDSDIWHFQLRMFNQSTGLYGIDANPAELTSRNSIPGISWYRKSVWEKVGGFEYPLAEDWDFWLRCYKQGFLFQYVPLVVYNYNKHQDSVSAHWTGINFEKIRTEILTRNGY